MQFQYVAKSNGGALRQGVIQAESPAAARLQLKQQAMFVMSLGPASSAKRMQAKSAGRMSFGSRVSKRDLLMLTSQLSIMCKAGIDLAESIQNCAAQTKHPKLKKILDQVYRDIADGSTVSAALRKHTAVFGEFYVAGVAAGEASGSVSEVLQRLADLLRAEIRLRSSVSAAVSYPVILLSVSFLVLGALIFFVLPQFAKVFEQMEVPAPALTQMLLDFGSELRARSWLYLGGAAVLIVVLVKSWGTETARGLRDRIALHAPGLREVTQALLLGRTFRLMGTMLQNGVPLLEAIGLCRSSIRNTLYRRLFNQLEESVLNGRGIGQTLSASSYIPSGAAQMAFTAERTGKLDSVMQLVGQFYEDEGERRLQEMAKLLEPAIIVVMGLVVGCIVLAIMLPIFEFSSRS
jgi:type IV pilus assembly protein PilC